MFFIRFFRFLTGYVVFTGKNGFPERFLNLCALNGINIWDAKAFGGQLEAKTSIRCYKNIRQCAKKSGMKIRITKKCGLPFLIRPYLNRKGIAVGIVLSVILAVILSSTVWTIDVSGNVKYTDEQILELAEAYGIYIGAFKSRIDQKAIKEDIRATYDNISWFSANTDGSTISVEIMEREDERTAEESTAPCNIVAGTDGEVLKLDAYTGTPEIAVGSAVKKGDLLISGIKEKADGSAQFVHAKGQAIIRTKKEITSAIKNTIECNRITSVNKEYTLYIFSLKIPLGKNYAESGRTTSSMLIYNGVTLPLGIITDSTASLQKEKFTLNESQSNLLCSYAVFQKEKEIMKNAQTEQKEITLTQDGNSTSITISYINHETSGIEYYFVVEDTNSVGKNAQ